MAASKKYLLFRVKKYLYPRNSPLDGLELVVCLERGGGLGPGAVVVAGKQAVRQRPEQVDRIRNENI